MLYFERSGSVHRSAATALLMMCMLESACKKEEAPAATQSAALKESVAAPPVDAKNPCTVPSASAAHVAQTLGTGPLKGPQHYPGGVTERCNYHGADTIIIELNLQAFPSDLESARKQMEQHLGGPTTDVPGFGDKAFSHVSTTDMGKEKLVINSLGVIAGKTLVFLSSKAPFEKIRALETDLLRDLGAR
jgi:hypothetical protein